MNPRAIQAWAEEVATESESALTPPSGWDAPDDVPDDAPDDVLGSILDHVLEAHEDDDDNDDDDDDDEARSLSAYTAQTQLSPQPSSASSDRRRRERHGRRKRPKLELTRDSLASLQLPIRFGDLTDLHDQLPPEAHALRNRLENISKQKAFLPRRLKTLECFAHVMAEVQDHMWQPEGLECDQLDDEGWILQHRCMANTRSRALEASEYHMGTYAWTCQAAYPIMDIALRCAPFPLSVDVMVVTRVMLHPEFEARNQDGQKVRFPLASTRKTQFGTSHEAPSYVDAVLYLKPDAVLQAAIAAVCEYEETISQANDYALSSRPAPVFMQVTVPDGPREKDLMKLGLWAAAWYNRLRTIHGRPIPRIITVPMIHIVGHDWQLLFVIDEGDHIVIRNSGIVMGRTDTFLGLYQLRAALLAIAVWIEGDFLEWFRMYMSLE